LLTRRVSIGDGAHRKKSHADGSSPFQRMSSAVGRSHFDPPNAAGGNKEHGKNRLVVTRNIRPCKGRAPQRIRLGTFVTISTGVCMRGNVKRQGRRSIFRGADAKRNCRAIGVGPRITASSSIGFGLVSKHAGWRPPRKIHPRGLSVCKARRRVSGVSRRHPIFETRLNVVAPCGAYAASSRECAQDRDDPVRFRGSARRISHPAIVSASRPAARHPRGADRRIGRPGQR